MVADGITYTMGIFLVEIMKDFQVGSEATSWIASILVAVTLGSGECTKSVSYLKTKKKRTNQQTLYNAIS